MAQLADIRIEDLWDEIHLLTFSQKVIGLLIFLLVTLFAAYFFWWRMDVENMKFNHQKIETAVLRLNKQSDLLLEQPQIELELAKLRAQLPVLQSALPTERELAVLLDRIHGVIRSNTMNLSEFTPYRPSNLEVMRVVPVKLGVSGNGSNVSRIPNHVAMLTRKVNLSDFEAKWSDENRQWDLTGTLKAYAQLPHDALQPEAAETTNIVEGVQP